MTNFNCNNFDLDNIKFYTKGNILEWKYIENNSTYKIVIFRTGRSWYVRVGVQIRMSTGTYSHARTYGVGHDIDKYMSVFGSICTEVFNVREENYVELSDYDTHLFFELPSSTAQAHGLKTYGLKYSGKVQPLRSGSANTTLPTKLL